MIIPERENAIYRQTRNNGLAVFLLFIRPVPTVLFERRKPARVRKGGNSFRHGSINPPAKKKPLCSKRLMIYFVLSELNCLTLTLDSFRHPGDRNKMSTETQPSEMNYPGVNSGVSPIVIPSHQEMRAEHCTTFCILCLVSQHMLGSLPHSRMHQRY